MFNKKGIALNHLTYDDLPHIGHSICTSIIATVKNNLSELSDSDLDAAYQAVMDFASQPEVAGPDIPESITEIMEALVPALVGLVSSNNLESDIEDNEYLSPMEDIVKRLPLLADPFWYQDGKLLSLLALIAVKELQDTEEALLAKTPALTHQALMSELDPLLENVVMLGEFLNNFDFVFNSSMTRIKNQAASAKGGFSSHKKTRELKDLVHDEFDAKYRDDLASSKISVLAIARTIYKDLSSSRSKKHYLLNQDKQLISVDFPRLFSKYIRQYIKK